MRWAVLWAACFLGIGVANAAEHVTWKILYDKSPRGVSIREFEAGILEGTQMIHRYFEVDFERRQHDANVDLQFIVSSSFARGPGTMAWEDRNRRWGIDFRRPDSRPAIYFSGHYRFSDRDQVRTTAAHELGHWFGVSHTKRADDLMGDIYHELETWSPNDYHRLSQCLTPRQGVPRPWQDAGWWRIFDVASLRR